MLRPFLSAILALAAAGAALADPFESVPVQVGDLPQGQWVVAFLRPCDETLCEAAYYRAPLRLYLRAYRTPAAESQIVILGSIDGCAAAASSPRPTMNGKTRAETLKVIGEAISSVISGIAEVCKQPIPPTPGLDGVEAALLDPAA